LKANSLLCNALPGFASDALSMLLLLLQVSEAAMSPASTYIASPAAYWMQQKHMLDTKPGAFQLSAAAGVRSRHEPCQHLHRFTCGVLDR
jgi:hypothetical protein